MKASLRYYWRIHLAVLLGTAITTAVLTGALLVGDSVRGSLRALALDRLGGIDHALLGEGFFREALARETGGVPVVLLRGAAVDPEEGRLASEVNVLGVDGAFAGLWQGGGESFVFDRAEGQFFPSVAINATLQRELGVAVGDAVLLRLGRPSDVPRESLMGATDVSDVVETMRGVVSAIVPDRGPGRFGLALHQAVQRNAFVSLGELQKAIEQEGRANAALYRQDTPGDASPGGAEPPAAAREALVREHLALEDLGIEVENRGGVLAVRSREILIRPALEEAILEHAESSGARALAVSTYLANRTRRMPREGEQPPATILPYSTISALELPPPEGGGELLLADGSPAPALGDDEVLLNQWAARDLGARAGDRVSVEYWEVAAREELVPREVTLRVRGVVRMTGLGADPDLAPEFPGVADTANMSDWDPTFPVDLELVRDVDEDYWDRYRAAPKLFVAESLGRRLWGSTRFGPLTEIRLVLPAAPAAEAPPTAPEPDDTPAEIAAARLRDELAANLPLPAAGLSVVPLRAEALEAGRGATDFSGLFVGFSLFLIVSAALLVALFFRLGVERRAREIGIRLAIGETARAVRRRMLREGAAVAAGGVLVGSALAAAYAWAMIQGLRTLWSGAIGGADLRLFVTPQSLAIGAGASLLVVLVAVAGSVRRLTRRPVVPLLRGELGDDRSPRRSRFSRGVLLVSLVAAAALFAVAFLVDPSRAAPYFFGLGAALLAAGLASFVVWLGRRAGEAGRESLLRRGPAARVTAMAAANLTLHPGRSLLSVLLVAAATFVIVAIGAYGHDFRAGERDRTSGTGGFQLVAQSDIPLFHDLGRSDGRAELGFEEDADMLLAASRVMPFRVRPGDDVSCLNLYRPREPRLLGVPPELVERGGFRFQQVLGDDPEAEAEPWRLLEQDLGPGVVPAIGDYNSVLWILHQRLGGEIALVDEAGRPLRLRLVGLLRKSLFQSELLISEAAFQRHFPSQTGYRFFLVETPEGREQEVAGALESTLEELGFDTEPAGERLQAFQAVENTYLATFRTLGGLGLLLGTFGLAVILVRNVLERMGELATLRAVGFRRSALGWMVFAENALLLVLGLALGSVAAIVAVAPHLASGGALVPWRSLAATLLLVAAVGLGACAFAVRQVARAPLLPALRTE